MMHLTRRRRIRKIEDGRSPGGRMDQEGDEREGRGREGGYAGTRLTIAIGSSGIILAPISISSLGPEAA
jgi:hypothetical protein